MNNLAETIDALRYMHMNDTINMCVKESKFVSILFERKHV